MNTKYTLASFGLTLGLAVAAAAPALAAPAAPEPISVIGKIVPCLDVDEGELSALITVPLASINVKTSGGSVRVDAPEAGE